jgi:hypothetical protein
MPIPRFLKWLFSWRMARRALLGLACLVTAWALFCTEENIRGKHSWDRYRRGLEARGEQLDYKAFIPKPIPDEQNFAATPVITSWFARSNNVNVSFDNWKKDNYGLAEASVADGQNKEDSDNRRFLDLVAWGTAFDGIRSGTFAKGQKIETGSLDRESRAKAAPSVLAALETNEAVFAELRAVSQRPLARYPVNYDVEDPFSILLPHLGSIRNVCRRLRLKACAELAVGRSDDAFADVTLMLRLVDSLQKEPFVISHLVRVACLQLATEPVWEGLAEHRWTDEQLREFQRDFQPYNFVADVRSSFEAERAAAIVTIQLIRKRGLGFLLDLTAGPGSPAPFSKSVANCFGMIVPPGWLYLEEYSYCRAYSNLLEGTMDPSNKRVFPQRCRDNHQALERESKDSLCKVVFVHHRVMAAILNSFLDRVILKAAIGQTDADEARLACVLERYRLTNGHFPDALDALVPQFISELPHDVITGGPYKYRRMEDGQFVLYSVGWNEKDDGGVTGKTLFDEKEGDWVWQYPPLR